ncbi:MAG: c-type cytochrome [Planctomycetales bacterium]|nr:c-type cytochrome [Planctomycetales bacterium]
MNQTAPRGAVASFRLPALWLAGVLAGWSFAEHAPAATPIVPGFERLVRDKHHVPAVDGRVLAAELNCRSCHAGAKAPEPKPAPKLESVASRAKADWLLKFIADPHAAKPGTTMPSVLSGSAEQRQQQAEALTHFLVSLNPAPPQQAYASPGAGLLGEQTFFRVGCAACHHHLPGDGETLPTTMPLGDLAAKYTLPSLTRFLRDPLAVRSGGRMPSLNLTDPEARSIAAWLLKSPEFAQIQYEYFEGNWNELPDFSELKPVATGEAERLDVSYRKRDNQFALRFESGLRITSPGKYKFHIGSDDGSRLLIDGQVVVEVPGIHPFTTKTGEVELTAGGHSIVVEYFEQGGEEKLTVEFEGPGIKRQPLSNALSSAKAPPEAPDLTFKVDVAKAKQGRDLFASLGCASCHAADTGDSPLPKPTLEAPAWDRLRLEQGCLSERADGKAPQFGLSDLQRMALRAATRQPAGDNATQIHQTLTSFNCYACHNRGEIGGVEPARDAVFQTTMQEMGDEGRIPPKLDEAGAKLTDAWIDKILNEGAKDRPYMHTRMPRFGLPNVGPIRPLIVEADRQEPLPPLDLPGSLAEAKEHGRRMVGIRGFSCTQCHPFGRFPSKGIQSVDFQIMTQRLRKDWFRRYVRDPQAYRPRTRMPTAWPLDKPSLLKNIYDGHSELQIAAVWAYLEDGSRARIPEGMVTESMELIPVNEAIIYRNFIQDAGPRAVGVGYPEQIHQAFDANNLRLALLWEGRFIDASRHWTGRGQGFQPPAGENVLKFGDYVAFAKLDDAQAAWPTESARELDGYRFGGYELRGKELRPAFQYRAAGVNVSDYLRVEGDLEAMVRREFEVRDGSDQHYYLAAVGDIRLSDGWYEVDGRWRTRIIGAKPVLRESQGRKELLVPLSATIQFQQEYKW